MKQKKKVIICIISILILLGITVSLMTSKLRTVEIPRVMEEEETLYEEIREESANEVQRESEQAEKIEEPRQEENMEEEIELKASYVLAYYEFLKDYAKDSNNVRARFGLVFIDDNEIPELLMMEDDYHAKGVKVYTYDQDMVIELGEFGSSGRMQYVERRGMIFSHFMGQGDAYSDFFKMEGSEIKLTCNLHSWPDYSSDEFTDLYEIDGGTVDEEVFEAKWKELYEDQEYVLVGYEDGIPIKEAELASLLSKALSKLILTKNSEVLLERVNAQEEVLNAYEAFLMDYMQQWENSGEWEKEIPRFKLIYLDDDRIPELAIIKGMAHASGANIYTYEEGEIISIGKYGQYGAVCYREHEGIIFDEYDQGGNIYSSMYQVKGGEETLLQSFSERCEFVGGAEEVKNIYTIDGQEVSKEQYEEVYQKWNDNFMKVIEYDMCVSIEESDIHGSLTKELENLILTQEEVLRRNVLIKSGEEEEAILLLDYDDYDRDGSYEAFVILGKCTESGERKYYSGTLWFVGTDQCTKLQEETYRMIDGKMKLGPNRKYLFFYTDRNFTANISELWTVKNGEPVESEQSQIGQVVYREGTDFEIWMDAYDNYYEPENDLWTGHTYKPYFYHYNWNTDEVERYTGEIILSEQLAEICGFDLAAEIEAEGCEVTEIIQWANGIVTVNYVIPEDEEDAIPQVVYENVIWDCNENDYWRKEQLGVTSWKNAGVGGSFHL